MKKKEKKVNKMKEFHIKENMKKENKQSPSDSTKTKSNVILSKTLRGIRR